MDIGVFEIIYRFFLVVFVVSSILYNGFYCRFTLLGTLLSVFTIIIAIGDFILYLITRD